jgi:NAD(P)H dehydrogenase (quinone)
MTVLVLLAHPETNSFNHAIASTAVRALVANGHEVIAHDLYQEAFDPILVRGEAPKGAALPPAIQQHCEHLARTDGIIIVHPNWWGQPPAILKGWVDRVIRPGVAYEFLEGDQGEGVPHGLLRAQAAIVFNTSNTGSQREKTAFGDPLETIWKNCIFGLCGVPLFHRRMFNIVVTSSEAERHAWLTEVVAIVDRFFPQR